MLSEARRDRPLPVARFNHGYAFGEAVAEYARHLFLRYGLKLLPEQEGIAECRCVHRRIRASQGARYPFAVAIDVAARRVALRKT